ncbi:MAG: hypothetical protein RL173_1215 [Fibrobacterota bacterium]|jgi:hypothetical protein
MYSDPSFLVASKSAYARPNFRRMRLALALIASLAWLAGCDQSAATSPDPTSPEQKVTAISNGRILSTLGTPLAHVVVHSPRNGVSDTTDSLGRWSLPADSGKIDTLVLFIDDNPVGSFASTSPVVPHDLRLVRRNIKGVLDDPHFEMARTNPGLGSIWPDYGVSIRIRRRDGSTALVPVEIDSLNGTFAGSAWFIDGERSQTGAYWAETTDLRFVIGRSPVDSFDESAGDLSIAKFSPWNRQIPSGMFSVRWRYRDTVRVWTSLTDTTLAKRFEWRTSKDGIWRAGGASLLVECPSAWDPVLVVEARIVDDENIVHPSSSISLLTGNNDHYFSDTRVRTPPRLSLAVPELVPVLDSFRIQSHAQDTLGGKVVKRFLVWYLRDTVPILSDSQMVYMPDRRTEGSVSGRVVAVDDDAESTYVDFSVRLIQPAPSVEVTSASLTGFDVRWEPIWKSFHYNNQVWDRVHVTVLDSASGSVLLDTLLSDTAPPFHVERYFLAKNVRVGVRFEFAYWDLTDASGWGWCTATLPDRAANPL